MRTIDDAAPPPGALKRTLGTVHLWGLAVGLVISGEYFGWSYGWGVSGPLGFLLATGIVVALYVPLALCLSELATAVPEAGGAFAYAQRAFGPWGGYLAAVASIVEFALAPPAIAFGLGSYLHVLMPTVNASVAACLALLAFGIVNLAESKQSARFETLVTFVAIGELLVFIGVALPSFQLANVTRDGWMGGAPGVFAALPFAIWFFLGIEGTALAAEEAKDPARDLPRGFLYGIGTLVVLALGVMAAAGGAGDWKRLNAMDFPIPEAVSMALGPTHPWVKGFAGLGLFGLIASLNGILFSAARQVFAVARAGLLPASLATVTGTGVPVRAVACIVAVGLVSIVSGKTADLITLSALGALGAYFASAASLLRLRETEPALERTFCVPFFPWIPRITLALTVLCFAAIAASNPRIAAAFVVIVAGAVAWRFVARRPAVPSRVEPQNP
jgi:ethanolamine permease